MKKEEQKNINMECLNAWYKAMEYYTEHTHETHERLRNCSASVIKTGQYIILRSYRTLVAVIDTQTDTCYDLLRYVYGYTATSAQHISKFNHDYGSGKYGCQHCMRYYPI